jgi:3-hydroxy-5-phosphonooxypentane-2,4-dione thiolase
MVLRMSGGPSSLKALSNEQLVVDIQDALRLGALAVAVGAFIGTAFQTQTALNLTRLVDLSGQYGMPVLAVTATEDQAPRDAKFFRMACRICAELGAHFVKTYYVPKGFETVTVSCPVQVVIAGGEKVPELDALSMTYRALQEGAAGVDMGRNIFQSECPAAMVQAVRAVIHDDETPAKAFDLSRSLQAAAVKAG